MLIERIRRLRESSPILGAVHRRLREPYYRACELIYPQGAPARLSDGTAVRLHPRLLGMRPELYEPAVADLLRFHARAGSAIVDVGAHVGLHALMLSRHIGAAGRVIAVEASPSAAGLLRRHLAWNACANVSVVEAAAGDRDDIVEFSYRADATDPGGFANSLAYDIGGVKQAIAMRTLDSICDGLSPDVVKIDVEGAELCVLEGATGLLERASPVLIVAIHPEPMGAMGATPAALLEFLAAKGYHGRHLDGRPAIEPGFEEICFQRRAT